MNEAVCNINTLCLSRSYCRAYCLPLFLLDILTDLNVELRGHEVDDEPGCALLAAALCQSADQRPQHLPVRRLGRRVFLKMGEKCTVDVAYTKQGCFGLH